MNPEQTSPPAADPLSEQIAAILNIKALETYRDPKFSTHDARLVDRALMEVGAEILALLGALDEIEEADDTEHPEPEHIEAAPADLDSPETKERADAVLTRMLKTPPPSRVDTAEDMANEDPAGEIGPRIKLAPKAEPKPPADEPEDDGVALVHRFLATVDELGISDAAAARAANLTADCIKRWRSEGLTQGPYTATREKLLAFLDSKSVKQRTANQEHSAELRQMFDRWATRQGLSGRGAAQVLGITVDEARALRRGLVPSLTAVRQLSLVVPEAAKFAKQVNGSGARA